MFSITICSSPCQECYMWYILEKERSKSCWWFSLCFELTYGKPICNVWHRSDCNFCCCLTWSPLNYTCSLCWPAQWQFKLISWILSWPSRAQLFVIFFMIKLWTHFCVLTGAVSRMAREKIRCGNQIYHWMIWAVRPNIQNMQSLSGCWNHQFYRVSTKQFVCLKWSIK